MSYTHITSNQRSELAGFLRAGLKQKDIARFLNKDRTTIYRELQRNRTDKREIGYDVWKAKEKTKERRKRANQRFRKIENNPWLEDYIVKKLEKRWSPEEIAGRLNRGNDRKVIGKDSIYKFVYNKRSGLVKYLRCQKGKYRRRYGTRIREKQREEAKKKRIDKRPKIVEKRARIGDWEGDTIVGQERKIAILTHVERKAGYLMADKLERALAENVKETTIERFRKLPREKRYTITYDNGSEFAGYEIIGRDTKTTVYFANPYHSWERGTCENTNGLLRQFFPKRTPFAKITQKQLDKVVHLINNRPRKRLNYLTPKEVFNDVALRTRM